MNSRKKIRLVLIALVVSLFLFILYSIINIADRKRQIALQIEDMPNFELFQLNGNSFTKDSLDEARSTVFIYFHTDCDFCQHEIKSILENKEYFKEMQLVLISPEEIDTIRNFAVERGLINPSLVRILQDDKINFAAQFDISTTPYTLLYDKRKRLIKPIKGQVLYKTIIRELRNHEEKQAHN